MSRFIDRVVLHVSAGKGGNGCSSVHREKFKPLGGPDGGNGGQGGGVVFVVDPNVHTLLDFHFSSHAKAGNGTQGMGGNREGANGEDLILKVPDGTVVLDKEGNVLADMIGEGTRLALVSPRDLAAVVVDGAALLVATCILTSPISLLGPLCFSISRQRATQLVSLGNI